MNLRQQLGKKGEELAVNYLRSKGYKILQQRYRTTQGEIDIIAVYEQVLVFIEVKTRTSTAYGSPAEAVDYRKQNKIRQVALAFIQDGNHKYREFRFDVVSILQNHQAEWQLEHIKNAF